MATAVITDIKSSTKSINAVDYFNSSLVSNNRVTLINETLSLRTRINNVGIDVVLTNKTKRTVSAKEVLPFRIRITNIGIDAYGPGNAAPIGIAIVGQNNYVM